MQLYHGHYSAFVSLFILFYFFVYFVVLFDWFCLLIIHRGCCLVGWCFWMCKVSHWKKLLWFILTLRLKPTLLPSFTNSVLLSLSRFPSEEPDINTSDSDSSHSDRVIIGFEIWIRSLKPCYYLELLTQAVFRNDFSSKAFCQSFFHSHPLSWMQKGRKEKRQLFLSRLQFRILYSLAGSQRQSHLNYCGVLHLSFNQSFFHASHSDFSLIVKERERERASSRFTCDSLLGCDFVFCILLLLFSFC